MRELREARKKREFYTLGKITIGDHAVVSQRSYLCTGMHDIGREDFAISASPISIGPEAWLATDVFVAPGVSVGRGAVVGVGYAHVIERNDRQSQGDTGHVQEAPSRNANKSRVAAQQLGGTIAAQSDGQGLGASFSVKIPLSLATSVDREAAA